MQQLSILLSKRYNLKRENLQREILSVEKYTTHGKVRNISVHIHIHIESDLFISPLLIFIFINKIFRV